MSAREEAVIRCITAAALIGALGGFWFALVNGSIELFQNYVEGVWRYQVGARSFAAPLIGGVIGALAGANIHLTVSSERVDGFMRGALIGAAIAVLLALAQIALVSLAATFEDYRVFYQSLLIRFSGIIFVAAVFGAVAGLLKIERSLDAPIPGAIVGALTSVSFELPIVATILFTIFTAGQAWAHSLSFFVTNIVASHAPTLVAASGSGAVISAALGRKGLGKSYNIPVTVGVLLGTAMAVTTSSASFHYAVLGLFDPESSFPLALLVFRVLVGLLCGVAVGLAAAFAYQRFIAARIDSCTTASG
jgi:hypothetical protein